MADFNEKSFRESMFWETHTNQAYILALGLYELVRAVRDVSGEIDKLSGLVEAATRSERMKSALDGAWAEARAEQHAEDKQQGEG